MEVIIGILALIAGFILSLFRKKPDPNFGRVDPSPVEDPVEPAGEVTELPTKPVPSKPAPSSDGRNYSEGSKEKILQVINVFENGKKERDYDSVHIFNDGPNGQKQLTLGVGFTQAGSLQKVIAKYIDKGGKHAEFFSKFDFDDYELATNGPVISKLKEAGSDPLMRLAQDEVYEERYWDRAVDWFNENGFTKPLSMLVIFDSFVHSGSIRSDIRNKFPAMVPNDGGSEISWITQYVDAREKYLKSHRNKIVHKTVYRTQTFERLIDDNNWDLEYSFTAHGVAFEGIEKPKPKPVIIDMSGVEEIVLPSEGALSDFYGTPNKSGSYLEWFSFPYGNMKLYTRNGQNLSDRKGNDGKDDHRCHKKVKPYLEAAFQEIYDTLGEERFEAEGWNVYAGCFNYRKKRGGSTLSSHCLPKGQKVWTTSGAKNIEDMKVGDEVYSYKDGNLVKRKVSNFWANGYKPIVTVNLNGSKIKCSPEHKILILKKKTLPVEEWVQNKNSRGQKRASYWTEMIEAQDLKQGDKVVSLKGSNWENDIVFDDWFEILGMFIGDGCLHHRKGEVAYVSFQIPKEDRIRGHAEELLSRFYGKENLKFDDKQILSYRKQVFEDFLPYDKKSYDKTIPLEVWNAAPEQQLSFLRGYIYTDGCVIAVPSSNGESLSKFSFKAASEELIADLKILLNLFNFRNTRTTKIKAHSKVINGIKTWSKDAFSFCSTDTLGLLSLEEDEMYFERIDNSSECHRRSGRTRCMGYEEISPNFIYKSVKSIEFSKVLEEVFDIEVEDTHNFLVDGNVVSNSWGISIDLNPNENPFKRSNKSFSEEGINIMEKYGFLSGGRAWGHDYQHFQMAIPFISAGSYYAKNGLPKHIKRA